MHSPGYLVILQQNSTAPLPQTSEQKPGYTSTQTNQRFSPPNCKMQVSPSHKDFPPSGGCRLLPVCLTSCTYETYIRKEEETEVTVVSLH